MITLETPRLILRPLCAGDFSAVHSYASVPENVKYMTFGPNSEEDTRNFLKMCEEGWKAEPLMKYDFGITLRGAGQLIGALGIYLDEARRQGMMGWILHRDYWRQGYMSEAVGALIRFGFEELKLHRLHAFCYAENSPSYGLMEKLNMRREGHAIRKLLLRNVTPEQWCDEYQYAILAEEWKGEDNA